MKRVLVFLCLWLIGGSAFAADHLEPEEDILSIGLGPEWVEQEALYSIIVNTVFADAFEPNVLVRDVRGPGGSERDSVVGIRTEGRRYRLFRIQSQVNLYDYIILKRDEQEVRGHDAGHNDFNDDIRKRVPKRYQDVKTERCEIAIDQDTALRIVRVWKTMLRQTHYLAIPPQGYSSGVHHHFSTGMSGRYVMAGQIMDADATGNAELLVAVSAAMDAACQDKSQLATLQNRVETLEKSLGLPKALPAPDPSEQGEFPMITQAVFADGKLWLLTVDGTVFTITQGKIGSDEIALPETALDLWLDDKKPVIATCDPKDCRTWTLRRYEQGGWRDVTSIPTNGDKWGGVTRTSEGTMIVTSHRLIDIGTERTKITRLQQPIGFFASFSAITSILVSPKEVFISAYFGEWGGGVWRVDRSSGGVRAIKQHWKSDDGKREGDAALGAINALAWEPWQPDCLLAANGLVHFDASGSMIEVCGTKLRQLYFKGTPDPAKPENKEPCCTDAYFGLIQERDSVLAAGLCGLYRITAAGIEPLPIKPNYTDYGDVRVSFDVPGAVLVLSDVRSRLALSGSTPILIPR